MGSAQEAAWRSALLPMSRVQIGLPCQIGDYTDFYVGIHHATAVGKLFRPDEPLLPNYKWVPIGYHGRASTVQASGHAFPRPLRPAEGAERRGPAAWRRRSGWTSSWSSASSSAGRMPWASRSPSTRPRTMSSG